MTEILYNLIISPIELVVEFAFELLYRIFGNHVTNQGVAVIGVSLVISFLTLPLYNIAEGLQDKERKIQKSLDYRIKRIKKGFKGDEQFMMLQTYYRQNNYHPLYALRSSLSILLEIPFFIAAYHFLSHLEVLNGASFGPIIDLGKPDTLLSLGNFKINILPISMTLINCISSAIYLKGFSAKDKFQTYGMACIFLILLYNSPSGLVIYWTCNNIFSLVKNILYKVKNPKKIISIIFSVCGIMIGLASILSGKFNSRKKYIFMIFFMIITNIPLLYYLLKEKFKINLSEHCKFKYLTFSSEKYSGLSFFLSACLITVLLGLMIPSSVIASSPAEFVDIQNYKNPFLYLINSSAYAAGFFLIWSGLIFYMFSIKNRNIFNLLLWIISGIFIVNYMFFGNNLGVISSTLVFEKPLDFSKINKIINLLVILLITIILFIIFKFEKIQKIISFVLIVSTAIISINQIHTGNKILKEMSYIKKTEDNTNQDQTFTLSSTGKNVIVLMLDRAISGYVPYILQEKPELKEQYAGFTYYPNTLSHGFFTNFGVPALYGGYEYTVSEMNKRSDELLSDKHNEALKVMPLIFSQNNFDVTIFDPPYAGYNWVPDLSIFDDYKDIKAHYLTYYVKDNFVDNSKVKEKIYKKYKRNFFMYSIFKVSPLVLANFIYDDGDYYSSTKSYAIEPVFDDYIVLKNLPFLTNVTDEDKDYFISMSNCTTHELYMLQLPDFVPKARINIDNSEYKTCADGHIPMETEEQVMHYHVNAAAFIQLGKWFDYLRENNVWDNTRIILVADHGRGLAQFDYMLMKDIDLDVEWCNPLLMIKDFNSNTFKTSNEFMTNADVPYLACKDIIDSPVNPFSGKSITSKENKTGLQLVTSSHKWDTDTNNGNTFDTSDGHWYSVHDDIFNQDDWKLIK